MNKQLEKRIEKLERARRIATTQPLAERLAPLSTLESLAEARQEISQIKHRAEAAGDDRLALSCLRAFVETLELESKIKGELPESRSTNVVSVTVGKETGIRVAELYLARNAKTSPSLDVSRSTDEATSSTADAKSNASPTMSAVSAQPQSGDCETNPVLQAAEEATKRHRYDAARHVPLTWLDPKL